MKFRIFTFILLLISGSAFSHPNAILGPSSSTDPSLLLSNSPWLKTQLFWWCHNQVNNPGKKPTPISLAGIVLGHWSNLYKPDGSPNTAHIQDHFASDTELKNDVCGSVTPPPPPPCTSNCGHISGAETFEFKIKMGGTYAGLYVCEVGFGESSCKEGCHSGGDYMIVHKADNTDVTIVGPNKSLPFKEGELDGSTASVYLNSFNAGSSYFVRYCLNIERLIVGEPSFDPSHDVLTLNADINAQVPIGLTAYLNVVGLNTSIFHKCGDKEESINTINQTEWANLTTGGDYHVNTEDIFSMASNTTTCSWKILFTEAKNIPRPIFHEDSTYIHTELSFDLTGQPN